MSFAEWLFRLIGWDKWLQWGLDESADRMRQRCLRVAQDQARQLEEMGEHEKAECVRTVVSRIEALT